jgi:outer membrane autotransporter protein
MFNRNTRNFLKSLFAYKLLICLSFVGYLIIETVYFGKEALSDEINTTEISESPINYNNSYYYNMSATSDPIGQAEGIIIIGGESGAALGVNSTGNILNVTNDVGNKTVVGGGSMNSSNGDAKNNTVNINENGSVGVFDGSGVTGAVVGGISNVSGAEVANNTVNMIGGTVYQDIVGGASDNYGLADGNKVNITGGAVYRDVYGGIANNGTVANSTVYVKNGIIGNESLASYGGVIGGHGSISINNSVEIDSSNIYGHVIGGRAVGNNSSADEALRNKVLITGQNVNVSGEVTGGKSIAGNASYNLVNITATSADVVGDVYGGYSKESSSSFNNVTLSGVTIDGNVYGGYSANLSSSETLNNTVTLRGAIINGSLTGGHGVTSDNNTVSFESGTNKIYGQINATGLLLIKGGENLANATTYAKNINITGGSNTFVGPVNINTTLQLSNSNTTFLSNVTTAGVTTIAGGNNTFSGNLKSSSTLTVTGGNNTFADTNITTLSVTAVSINNFTGDVNATSLSLTNGNNTFNGLVNSSGAITLGANSNNTFLGALTGTALTKSGAVPSVYNTFSDVNISGTITIAQGINNFTGTTTANVLNVNSGNNTFNQINVNSSTIGGAAATNNVFNGDIKVNNLNNVANAFSVTSAGKTTFNGDIQVNGLMRIVTGVGNHTFNGGIDTDNFTIAAGTNVFNGDVNVSNTMLINPTSGAGTGSTFLGFLNVSSGLLNVSGARNQTFSGVEVNNLAISNSNSTVFNEQVDVAGNVTISKGISNFNDLLNVSSGNINLSGQSNISFYDINTVNLLIDNDGVNNFNGNITSTGNINISSGNTVFTNISTNNLTVLDGNISFNGSNVRASVINLSTLSNNYIDGNVSMDLTNGIIIDSALNFRGNSNLTVSHGDFLIEDSGTIHLSGNSVITIQDQEGLDIFGSIELGEYNLNVNGNVTFRDNSSIKVNYNDPNQGMLNVSDTIILDGRTKIELYDINSTINPSLPIFTANNYIISNGAEFVNDLMFIFRDGTNYYASMLKIEDFFDNINYTPTGNDLQLSRLMDRILDNYDNGNGDASLHNLAVKITRLLAEADLVYDRIARQFPHEAAIFMKSVFKQNSGESVLNVHTAVIDTALKSQGVVFRRLDRIHEAYTVVPPAAGSPDAFNRVWAGGFASRARQKDDNFVYGYDYNIGGFSIGYDRRVESVTGLRLGVVASFSSGKIESKSNFGSVDVETVGGGVYGSYLFDNEFFVDASFGYAKTKNDLKVNLVSGDNKTGKFDVDTWQVGARVGKMFDINSVKLTPTLGVRYLKLERDAFTESISTITPLGIENCFDKKSDSIIEIPVLVKLNTEVYRGTTKITPEIRLGYTFAAKKPDNELSVGIVGTDIRTTIYGIQAPSGTIQAGAGLKFEINDKFDVFVNYDLDAANKFLNHNAALGFGYNF